MVIGFVADEHGAIRPELLFDRPAEVEVAGMREGCVRVADGEGSAHALAGRVNAAAPAILLSLFSHRK